MKNMDPEKLTPSEEKLDLLVNTIEDMVLKMTAKNENGCEQVAVPKHFVSNPSCHRFDNDCFVDHLGEERAVDMTCMLDDVFYTDDLPQFDQYDDDYVLQTEANLANKSTASLWKEENHFQQLKYSDQPMHISYDSDEESAENFEVVKDIFHYVLIHFSSSEITSMQSEINCQQALIWTILRAMKTLFKTSHIQICSPRMPLIVKLQMKTWNPAHMIK